MRLGRARPGARRLRARRLGLGGLDGIRRRRRPRLVAVPAAGGTVGTAGSAGAAALPGAGRFGRRRRLVALGRVAMGLGAAAATALGVGLAVQPAQAGPLDGVSCSLDGGTANIGPEYAGGGATYWIPFIKTEDTAINERGIQQHPSQHTLWEVLGPRGLTWSYTPWALQDDVTSADFEPGSGQAPKDNFDERCSPVDAASGTMAQLMWEPSRFLGGLTIALKQLATNEAPFEAVYEGNQRLLDNMRTYFGVPALTIAVVVAGYWVAVRIHRHSDARETYAGVISSAVIVVAIAAVLAGNNYTTITAAVDKYTSSFNSGMMEIISVGEPRSLEGPCYLPDSVGPQRPGEGRDPDLGYNLGKRTSTCLLYEVLLYQPWVNGQFGSDRLLLVDDLRFPSNSDSGEVFDYCRQAEEPSDKVPTFEYRCLPQSRTFDSAGDQARVNLAIQQIVAQGVTRNEALRDNANIQDHRNHWLGASYAIAKEYPQLYEIWRGSEPSGRMATAVASLVVNLISILFIGLLALLTIFWHGVFLIAWVFLPLVGAIAAYPPARRIVKTVLGVMVQAVFLRCLFGLILAVLLAVLNMIQTAPGALPLKILLMLIATAAIWKLLGALRSGALSPQVSQEALQSGVVPSDSGASKVAVGAVVSARSAAGGAMRRGRGAVAGARAGRRHGEEAAAGLGYERGSDEWKDTVSRSRRDGAVTGYRSATPRGQEIQHAQRQTEREVGAPLNRQVHRKQRTDDVQRETSWRESDQERRARQREQDQEAADARHQEVLGRIRGEDDTPQ